MAWTEVSSSPYSGPRLPLFDHSLPGHEIRLCELRRYAFDESAESAEEDECAICMVAFAADDSLRVPKCGHAFHAKCLRKWFSDGANGPCCPTCRHRVSSEDVVDS